MNIKLSVRFALAVLAVIGVLALSACGTTTSAPLAAETIETSIQLSWIYDYASAGYYAAELNGHYAKQGLKVVLAPGGFVEGRYVEPIDEVLEGLHDFGMASDSSVLQAREQGKPIVAIATILQRSPSAIISLASANITRPQDLIGKTVAVAEGGAAQIFKAMLESQNIAPSDVNIVPRTDFGIEPLLNGDVDALYGWLINEGVLVREAGQEPNFILISDYGIDTYNSLIFTTEKIIKERPELVERFLRATLAGLQDVVNNPEQAVEFTLRYNSELKQEEQLARLQAAVPLIRPARAQVGMMQASNWDVAAQIMVDAGTLASSVDVSQAYTLGFLNKIYADQS